MTGRDESRERRTLIRPPAIPRFLRGELHFRWRGGDVSRIESLSDAVFAFSLTLLVVSLEVPSSVEELFLAIRQFPVFGLCFAFLVWCWFLHYRFHRRFGLENAATVALNGLLLFTILFYVYPLKFIAGRVFSGLSGVGFSTLSAGQGRTLMAFYCLGFLGIFLLFAVLNLYAYRHRQALGLDAIERYLTRLEIRTHLVSCAVGLLALALSLGGRRWLPWAGLTFFLMGPAHFLNGLAGGRGLARRLAERESRA